MAQLSERLSTGSENQSSHLFHSNQPKSLVSVHRAYATHTSDLSYKRRISWLSGNTHVKAATAEYIETFPGRQPNGKSKKTRLTTSVCGQIT